ncbi:MAG: T9SS type A sorting domain-containing protein [Panacibacter sp.]
MKTLAFYLIPVLLLPAMFVNAQVPLLQGENCFGGTDVDHGFSIQQTKDGGFIFAGSTASYNGDVRGNHGQDDFWVVKLNKNGTLKWQKPLGGKGDDVAFSVQQTADAGYVVAGESNSFDGDVTGNHGNLDFWVVKLDGSGNLLWQKSLGGTNSDFATSLQQTKDGGYIIAGGSYSLDGDVSGHHGPDYTADYWLVKLDAGGNKQWVKSYGGSNGDIAQSVRQTKDGGYIIAGNSTSNDGDVTGVHDFIYGDEWIIKTDANGNLQWQKSLGGSDYEQANSIIQTTDNGYIAAGWSRSNDGDVTGNHGDYDFWITKLSSSGSIQWQKSLGGSGGDLAYSIEQTKDNGYIVAGGTTSNNGDVTGWHGKEDFWIVKLDNNGIMLWQKTLGGTEYEEARTVDQTRDGGYVTIGWSGWDHPNNGDVTGNHSNNYDVWVAKLSAGALFADNLMQSSDDAQQLAVRPSAIEVKFSPNPAASFLSVTITSVYGAVLLKIMNSSGKAMIEKTLEKSKGNYQQQLNVSALPAGLYYISVQSGNDVITRKFIKK